MAKKLSSNLRIELFRSLKMMARGKVQTYGALRKLHEQYSSGGKKPKNPLAMAAEEAIAGMASGEPLAQSLGSWIPESEASILAAGERSGDLAKAYQDAINLIKRQQRMSRAIWGGLAYPIFMMVMICVFLSLISYMVVPAFARMSPMENWTGGAAALATVATLVTSYGIFVLIGMAGLIVAGTYSASRWAGGWRIKLDEIPPWSIYRRVHGAIFLANVAVMLRSGSQLMDVLLFLQRNANPWLRLRIQDTIYGIGQGHNMGEALIDAGYNFPSKDALPFISIIAEQEGFEVGLAEFSEEWLNTTTEKMEDAGKVAFVIGIVLIVVILGLVQVGLFSLQNNLIPSSRL